MWTGSLGDAFRLPVFFFVKGRPTNLPIAEEPREQFACRRQFLKNSHGNPAGILDLNLFA
jgi:hypothetical protein